MDTNILIAFIPLLKNIIHKSKQGNIKNTNVFHIYILTCLVLALFSLMILGTFSNIKNHEIQYGITAVLISIYYSIKLYTCIEKNIIRNNTNREIINFIQVAIEVSESLIIINRDAEVWKSIEYIISLINPRNYKYTIKPTDAITYTEIIEDTAYTLDDCNENFISYSTLSTLYNPLLPNRTSPVTDKNPFTNLRIHKVTAWKLIPE